MRNKTGKLRPLRWKNSDPLIHKKYMPFLRHRAQCAFRKEDYELTFEDWLVIWTEEAWSLRGRDRNALCMTRKDVEGSWRLDNCELVTRVEMLRRNANWKNRIYLKEE